MKDTGRQGETLRGKRRTLFRMLTLRYTCVFLAVSVLLIVVFAAYSFTRSRSEYLVYSQMILRGIENRVSAYFQDTNDLTRAVIANGRLWEYAQGSYAKGDKLKVESELEGQLRVLLSNIYYSSSHITCARLVLPAQGVSYQMDKEVLLSNKPFRAQSQEKANDASLAALPTGFSYRCEESTGNVTATVAVSQPFTRQRAFYFQYVLSGSLWEELLHGMTAKDETVLVFNHDFSIAYCSQEAFLPYAARVQAQLSDALGFWQAKLALDKEYLVTAYSADQAGWVVAKAIPESVFLYNLYAGALFYVLCGLAGVGVFALLSVTISRRVTQPLARLSGTLARLTPAHFVLDVDYRQNDEIGFLLRYNLANSSQKVRVVEEVSALNHYFSIIRKSYGTRLSAEVRMGEETAQLSMIPFVLQPIVENAFKHGLSRKVGAIRIQVETLAEDGNLLLRITDNGIGMDKETVRRLNRECEEPPNPDIVGGQGLSLIQRRIRLEYGDGYGVRVKSYFNIGTTLTVTLPAVCEEQEDAP